MGTEEVKYENGFLDPFLGKKMLREFPKVAFSSSQMCFSSCLRNITSITLVHPFVFCLLFV